MRLHSQDTLVRLRTSAAMGKYQSFNRVPCFLVADNKLIKLLILIYMLLVNGL